MNVTVALQPMSPYINLDLMEGVPVASGCLGDLWTLLAELLALNSIYSVNTEDKATDVLLLGATGPHPNATQLAFVSSWYDIHVEESLLAGAVVSYLQNWSPGHWLSTVAMAVLYPLALFAMLKVADKLYPVTSIDLPRIIPIIRWGSAHKTYPVLPLTPRWRREHVVYRRLRVLNEESLGHCVMASVALVSNQGLSVQSHVSSIRILMISFLLFGMIMSSAFSAMLVSQLSAGRNVEKGLADKEGTSLCVRRDSLPFQLQVAHQNIMPSESCAQSLCSSVAVLETPELVALTNVPCRMHPLQQRQFVFKLAISVMPKAPEELREALRLKLCQLREIGITSRIQRKWLNRPEMYWLRGTIHEVSFFQVAGIFFSYLLVLLFVLVLLLFEKMFYKKFKPV